MPPRDMGPIYKETDMSRFIVEPWNTASNFLFLLVFIYFSIKVYSDFKNHKFLAFSLPILLVGFVGGTLYHATRSNNLWLFMDWIPIALLTIMVSVHFALKQRMYIVYISLLIVLPFVFRYIAINTNLPKYIERMMGYPILALIILIPIVRWLNLTNYTNWLYILVSLISFILAIFFRIIDLKGNNLPMGTHWLWHVFGGISTYFLTLYIFKDDKLYKRITRK